MSETWTLRVMADLADIDAAAWDALAGPDDPFAEHAFLSTLEKSGSVGEGTGWQPLHLALFEGGNNDEGDSAAQPELDDENRGTLIGALPLYLKTHSYGEYIFDWGWADGARRAGIPYYPKLVSMTPLTPATGRRFLVHPERERGPIIDMLLRGVLSLAAATNVSSVHLLFLNEEERAEVAAHDEWMMRLSSQYHWHSAGDADFDAYVGRFRSSMRKNARKERRRVTEAGLRTLVKEGPSLTSADWSQLHAFYEDTCNRKGSYPYLTPEFFSLGAESLRDRAVAVFAYDGDRCVAGTLNFEKGPHLYGRYWGALEDYDMLHFELCYYQLIERAIDRGLARFEAGAQGRQKLRRGLLPAKVHSAHWIREPALAQAVGAFLQEEAFAVSRQIAIETEKGPFRRGDS